MYYGSGTVDRSVSAGRRCCTCTEQTPKVHSADGSSFLHEMTRGHLESVISNLKLDSIN